MSLLKRAEKSIFNLRFEILDLKFINMGWLTPNYVEHDDYDPKWGY